MNKKIAFIDRDGVINKKAPEHQYITKINDFIFNQGIFELLLLLKKRNFEIIIITNQRGLARKILSLAELTKIHEYLIEKLKEKDIKILDLFYCPHEINSCDCRKPRPGMIKLALAKYNIDLARSIIISDSKEESQMAEELGIKNFFLVPADNLSGLFEKINKLPN
jgi:D-glycero-D-manno-heptose 1,7-bisphosphate phosphatase